MIQQHFGEHWIEAYNVAKAESSLKVSSHNYNPLTKDNSYGLFQINIYGNLSKSRPSGDWLLVAENNISYAANMFASEGWCPWTKARALGYCQ